MQVVSLSLIVGHVCEERLHMSLDEFCFNAENGSNRERMRKKNYECDTQVFKSKNLEVERRRREKLSTRLLMLRSLMNKATIVEDAITYIEIQQNIVQSLSYELHEMEATLEEIKRKKEEIDASEKTKLRL
ncbi:hypothetical protein JHK82_052486 [Glycine max]|nr:hypothetical protein JHK85_053186 [Glycine max]KAG5082334.1 hypothetical protein JHK84_052372 [Glycine max]KAG5085089.1 hypothetical protein JHK82_052486 [Glycine max]